MKGRRTWRERDRERERPTDGRRRVASGRAGPGALAQLLYLTANNKISNLNSMSEQLIQRQTACLLSLARRIQATQDTVKGWYESEFIRRQQQTEHISLGQLCSEESATWRMRNGTQTSSCRVLSSGKVNLRLTAHFAKRKRRQGEPRGQGVEGSSHPFYLTLDPRLKAQSEMSTIVVNQNEFPWAWYMCMWLPKRRWSKPAQEQIFAQLVDIFATTHDDKSTHFISGCACVCNCYKSNWSKYVIRRARRISSVVVAEECNANIWFA